MTLHAGRRLRAFVVAVGLVVVLPLVATGQSRATPWGDPDLQGVWDYWTFTPLERADEFAGRDTLTAEEAAIVGEAGRAAARATDRQSWRVRAGGLDRAVARDGPHPAVADRRPA